MAKRHPFKKAKPGAVSHHSTIHQIKTNPERDFFLFGDPGGARLLLKQKSSTGRRLKISKTSFRYLFGSYGGRTQRDSSPHHNSPNKNKSLRDFFLFGDPGGTRTHDTKLKRLVL